jgi:hypothetical protein
MGGIGKGMVCRNGYVGMNIRFCPASITDKLHSLNTPPEQPQPHNAAQTTAIMMTTTITAGAAPFPTRQNNDNDDDNNKNNKTYTTPSPVVRENRETEQTTEV